MKKHVMNLLLAVSLMGAVAIPTLAQVPAGGNGGNAAGANGGGGQRGGGRNRGDWQAARAAQMQKDLGATDDEMKVLKPKIEAVQKLQREEMMSRFAGMGGRRRGNNNNNADQPAPAVSDSAAALTKAAADLRTVLADAASTPDQIKAALKTLRDAREKSKAELTKVQDDLRSVVSVRQEAVLVQDGILE